jgi:hypothetical protein
MAEVKVFSVPDLDSLRIAIETVPALIDFDG